MKKFGIYGLCIILLLFCAACSENSSANPPEIMRVSENADSGSVLTIDDCFTISVSDELTYTQNDPTKIVLTKNSSGKTAGGIEKYAYQEASLPNILDSEMDPFQFLNAVGIPVDPNALSAHMISAGLYGGWEVWLYSDTMDVTHNLFVYNGCLYNVWFYTEAVDSESSFQILDSIQFLTE